MDVKFLRGLQANYNAIKTKDQGTFYITGPNEGNFDSIYLGQHLLGTKLASGIVLTGYNLGEGKSTFAGISATEDSVLSAIQKLDIALSEISGEFTEFSNGEFVTSFGGAKGAITLSDAGNVALSMVGNALKADVDLSDYVTSGTLGTTLEAYVTSVSLTQTLGNYVTNNALGERLSGYVTSNSLTETLKGYATAAQGALADTAIQSVITGTANGTISVDGEDVAVKGLGSAAFTDSSAYQPAGDYQPAGNYQEALTAGNYINIDENNNISTVQGSFATTEAAKVEGLATVGAVETYVASQFAAKLTWGSF